MKVSQIGLALLFAGLLTFVSPGETLGQTTGTISGVVTLELHVTLEERGILH